MTVLCAILFLSIRSLLRFDILVWIVGLPVLVGAAVLLYYQFRQYRSVKSELRLLSKVKIHSVEYDLVLKAMKLAIWRIDIATHTITIESDYRDAGETNDFPPNTSMNDIYEHVVPEDATKLRQVLLDLVEGRTEVSHLQFQMRVPHSSRTYWIEGYATVDKRNLEGLPQSIVGTLMRIDQQKEIEQALMEAVYHAEESDRLKSAFLANISHEIRTPLNAIVGFSEVLAGVEDPEERQGLMDLIKHNNAELLRIFDDIVSMSKLEARGGGALKLTTFLLKSVFDELSDKYREKSEETGVAIVVEDIDHLPQLTTDKERLREVLNQYLNNAMKFTSKGQVTLGCTSLGHQWRIWVRDTGKGIPADMCNDHLFERFVKVDEFVSGTGLGLSICRSLALSMNGTVGVESEVDKGSTFWIDLDKK
jgi:signal transduction histidine kinase